MRILLLAHGLPVGGTEMVICHLARSLRRIHAVEVEIGCLDEIGSLGNDLLGEGFRIECYSRRPGIDPRVSWRIARHARGSSIDLIHAHQTTCYVYAVLGKLITGIPIVFTEHGRFHPDVSTRRRRAFNRAFSRMVDRVTAVSTTVRNSLTNVEGLPVRNIDIIPNGIDVTCFARGGNGKGEARSRLRLHPDALVIGTVARLDPIKNHTLLIRSVARLRGEIPSLVLLIVGDGAERERLQRFTHDLGMSETVRFLGERNDVAEILPAFDVFALSSLSEGIPMTLLEAMAASLPIVATAVGGIPEILEDGVEASLVSVPNGDLRSPSAENEFVETLRRVLVDPALRSRLAENAAARVRRDFSLESMVERYASLYREVLARA